MSKSVDAADLKVLEKIERTAYKKKATCSMSHEGNYRLGDLFTSRREKGHAGLPTLSVTLNNGLVNRNDLDRKQDTALAPNEHLLVKPGDIAYNMMRMWQGAFGLAAQEGLVSPAYVVLRPRRDIDPRYASYLFKTRRMIYLFWAYSYGMTEDRLRLYFPDFAKIPATIPSRASQMQIAQLLATWDRAIEVAEKLKLVNGVLRRGIVLSLVLGGKRLRNHNATWKRVKLRTVATIIVSSVDKKYAPDESKVALCNYTHVYYNRYLDGALEYDSGTATAREIERFKLQKCDIVITKDSEEADDIGVAACVTEDVDNLVCGYHLAIVRPDKNKVDSVFLSAIFSLHEVRKHFATQANGVTRFGLPVKAIESLSVRLPPLSEQQDISRLILVADRESAIRERQLNCLKREREALAEQFFKGFHVPKRAASSVDACQ